jgi:hypothetical protein
VRLDPLGPLSGGSYKYAFTEAAARVSGRAISAIESCSVPIIVSQRGGSTAVANRATVRRLIPNRAAISRYDTPSATNALT